MNAAAPRPVRVVMVEDSEVVRMGLRALLGNFPEIAIAGEAATVAAAARTCVEAKVDVALLDIRLPDGTGFDACRQILARLPDTRILMLTSVVDDALVSEAIRAGAHGYLLKEIDGRGLVHAILEVAAGKSILDPTVAARVMQLLKTDAAAPSAERAALSSLSPQERRVLALIAEGRTNKEAAQEMNLSEKTVKNYLSTLFDKLHVSRRAQAAAIYAQEQTRQDG